MVEERTTVEFKLEVNFLSFSFKLNQHVGKAGLHSDDFIDSKFFRVAGNDC